MYDRLVTNETALEPEVLECCELITVGIKLLGTRMTPEETKLRNR